MKKKLLFLPLLGLLVSGCSLSDILSFASVSQNSETKQNSQEKPEENAKTDTNTTDDDGKTDDQTPGTDDTKPDDQKPDDQKPDDQKPDDQKPDDQTNQIMSIKDVKDYISEHPVEKNEFGNGVNTEVEVKIQGYALARIDLIKSVKAYGLDVSYPGKVILADETGWIAAATVVNNQGTSLWGKVGDHVCESTSKYEVTGYISEYLGHPEIMVKSFEWKSDLDISLNASILSKGEITLNQFYEDAKSVNYNCAGHGYGDVVTLNNMKCYYMESDGQGVRYYNFTDGTKNIRVNAFNLSSVSVGSYYNVTGIISLKNLSPIVVAFDISQANTEPFTFDYSSLAENITIENLKKICGSQDDTSKKYPEVIETFGKVYKTTGYLCGVTENNKLYIGISDTYYSSYQTGKDNSMAQKNISLFKNNDFWNTTETSFANYYESLYTDYLLVEEQITVYYVVRQLRYQSKKAIWETLLIPEFADSFKASH